MGSSSHYDTLGVNRDASIKEIKSVFLRLSKETHPDVGGRTANLERFKAISEAATVLTNPRKKEVYDRELDDISPFGPGQMVYNRRGDSSWQHSSHHKRRHHQQQQRTSMDVFVQNIMRPRTFAIGFVSIFAFGYISSHFFGLKEGGRIKAGKDMVQAWKNPTTQQWEQPAPWDPIYQKLKPELVLVNREEVKRRHR